MTYGWAWWWLLWVPLLFVLIWAAVGWWPGRYYGYRDSDWRSDPRMRNDWPYGGTSTPGPYRGRGPRGYKRSDERIAEDINDRLMVSGDIDATDVLVQVQEGVVTLSGTVLTRPEKRLAEALAEEVAGVQDVKNELTIGKRKEFPRPHVV